MISKFNDWNRTPYFLIICLLYFVPMCIFLRTWGVPYTSSLVKTIRFLPKLSDFSLPCTRCFFSTQSITNYICLFMNMYVLCKDPYYTYVCIIFYFCSCFFRPCHIYLSSVTYCSRIYFIIRLDVLLNCAYIKLLSAYCMILYAMRISKTCIFIHRVVIVIHC